MRKTMKDRLTEIKNNGSDLTQIMGTYNTHTESNPTEIIGYGSENKTALMHNAIVGYVPADLSVGHTIDGYHIVDVVSENTGEATLLLSEKDSIKYVLKIYHKGKSANLELASLISEIDSSNILKVIGTGKYGERQYEVIPYFKNGDLLHNFPISSDVIENIIIPGINNGLNSLHQKGIIHRDIKPSNIFFSDDYQSIIIGDFGISSILKSDVSVRVTNMSRTFGYAAPETSTGFVSRESDYYSFGITLLHLFLNQDPFAGMTDLQILYQTINKKLDIPQSIPIRLANLIRGLTIKERADRWGYEEVNRWINNEEVEIIEKDKHDKAIKPYQFSYGYYYDLESLSMAFAINWENAKKHLFRGLVEKHLFQYGEELTSNCIDLKAISDKNIAVFRLIRLLNPGAPLCYKGRIFNDLAAVGIAMYNALPAYDQNIIEMITNGCFIEFLKANKFDGKLIAFIEKCQHHIKTGKQEFYYAIMYMLSGKTGYEYNQYMFNTLEEIVEYLTKLNPNEVEKTSSELITDAKFVMWIYSQGYTQQVEEWLKVYQGVNW